MAGRTFFACLIVGLCFGLAAFWPQTKPRGSYDSLYVPSYDYAADADAVYESCVEAAGNIVGPDKPVGIDTDDAELFRPDDCIPPPAPEAESVTQEGIPT